MFQLRAPQSGRYETPFGIIFIANADQPAVLWDENKVVVLKEQHGFVDWEDEKPVENTPAPKTGRK